ncbi:MAG: division/cell wall cluster transcriptional repressor MraZ [Eubacterium sp.]|nr:division/cell wall cluster transcriptional repressor MraZ [Candidatus Colimonas fimequi]
MFVGKFNNSIDSKARMIVPAKFRLELGASCVIAKGLDTCLTVYTEAEWDKFVTEKLAPLPDSNPNARKLKRYFFSSANSCEVDKQGRVKIPQDLLDYAGIDKELVTIGSNNTIEIWSKEEWDKQLDEESGELLNASEIAEGLEQYGF